ncbi:BPSL0067_family protein [Hexamita inflata]|uniref:BPSL0067 family protein n=1 Tax=Hexamita inflata TaxID=28002 RepID=A0AA86QTN5_9EUKA|nr:BPSL0067 family protein [Hexamita inflata]
MLLNPVFAHKSFKFDIFQRYILDTFLLIRELKSVTPLQASQHLPYKQGYVVYYYILIFYIFRFINNDGSIGGHAAVFVSQDSTGITVYDQWKTQPCHKRVIRFKGDGSKQNDGNEFYVIN